MSSEWAGGRLRVVEDKGGEPLAPEGRTRSGGSDAPSPYPLADQSSVAGEGERRIRVLMVAQPTIGGAAHQLWQLAAGLDRQRFRVIVAAPDDGWLRGRLQESAVEHRVIDFVRDIRLIDDYRAFLELRELVTRERPHVLHAHSSKAGFLGRWVARRCRVPVVIYTPHGFAFDQARGPRAWFYLTLERMAARWADRIICVSDSERATTIQRRLTDPANLVIIRNGVEVRGGRDHGRGLLRSILGVSDECRIVAMIARLQRPKCPEDLIEAAALLIGRLGVAPFRVVFVGGGALEPALKRQALEKGLADYVTFLGDREDVSDLIQDIDVLVLASSSEGMPYAILEAMAAGKPVVGTDAPGVRDLIRDDRNGFCYPPGGASELADALQRLLGDGQLRRRLGREGQRIAMADYTAQRMIWETEDLYLEQLQRGRGRIRAIP